MSAILFRNLRLLDPRFDEPRGGYEVLVEGERIREVSDRPIKSGGATAIDCGGRVLMPGLIDCHVHCMHSEVYMRRMEDVPLLVEHFLKQTAEETGGERRVYSPEALELLVANHWPGNVRQLNNTVRQNVALSPTRVITPEQVRTALGEQANQLPSFSEARDEFTRNYLTQLLQITNGNVSAAARLAKRNRTDFYKLLGRHQLNPEHFK